MRRVAALVVTCLLTLTACTSLQGTDGKEYVSPDGTWKVLPADQRGEPRDFTGPDLDGNELTLSDSRGTITVVNVWWSTCVDCRLEQEAMNKVAKETEGSAVFVGINTRDPSVEQTRSYVRKFEVPYPSFYSPGGEALLAFRGDLSPRTMPATLILDKEGRIAARILGAVPSSGTLIDLIDEVAEDG